MIGGLVWDSSINHVSGIVVSTQSESNQASKRSALLLKNHAGKLGYCYDIRINSCKLSIKCGKALDDKRRIQRACRMGIR
jgi:hypothetical protein